ncbi:MAG TPA: hypothetical protein VK816_09110 [Jatrophihabitantaceae bacterium]|jgi:hypothetical protein|nr:hypothetical protein [Jatrophihabitantaceae bacterium]
MYTSRRSPRIVGTVLAIGGLVLSATALPAAASAAASKLTCTAKMSKAHPSHNTTTDVLVHSLSAVSVKTVAQYKSTATSHTAETNSSGNAAVAYDISRATYGYKVVVTVTVSKKGKTAGSCSTSFTPEA